jgi:hypothetical protein
MVLIFPPYDIIIFLGLHLATEVTFAFLGIGFWNKSSVTLGYVILEH